MVALALVCAAVGTGCDGGQGSAAAIEGSVLAITSVSPDEVVLVEPETLDVIRRVRLRSVGVDPLALPERRMFVTAQCGGLGTEADDAIAVVDLARGGRVRYVRLPQPNPGSVELAGDGTVLVSHGVLTAGGIVMTRVDVDNGAIVGSGTIANAFAPSVTAAGSLWTTGPEDLEALSPDRTIRRTSFDLADSHVFPVTGEGVLLAADGDSPDTLLLAESGRGSVRASRVSAENMAARASVTLDDLRNGVCEMVCAGDVIVVRDSSGEDMTDPGGPLIVLDRTTLEELHRIDVGGYVASIAVLGETVYAIRWDSGEVVGVDPITGSIVARSRVPGLEGRMTQLAAMGPSRRPSEP